MRWLTLLLLLIAVTVHAEDKKTQKPEITTANKEQPPEDPDETEETQEDSPGDADAGDSDGPEAPDAGAEILIGGNSTEEGEETSTNSTITEKPEPDTPPPKIPSVPPINPTPPPTPPPTDPPPLTPKSTTEAPTTKSPETSPTTTEATTIPITTPTTTSKKTTAPTTPTTAKPVPPLVPTPIPPTSTASTTTSTAGSGAISDNHAVTYGIAGGIILLIIIAVIIFIVARRLKKKKEGKKQKISKSRTPSTRNNTTDTSQQVNRPLMPKSNASERPAVQTARSHRQQSAPSADPSAPSQQPQMKDLNETPEGLPDLATVPFIPGEEPFKIPAKNFKWRGPMRRRTRWHGPPDHEYEGKNKGVETVDKIWFDPNANYATEIGPNEIIEDGGPPSDSNRSEWLNNIDEWEKGHKALLAKQAAEAAAKGEKPEGGADSKKDSKKESKKE